MGFTQILVFVAIKIGGQYWHGMLLAACWNCYVQLFEGYIDIKHILNTFDNVINNHIQVWQGLAFEGRYTADDLKDVSVSCLMFVFLAYIGEKTVQTSNFLPVFIPNYQSISSTCHV
jgi:hypothetical protein